MSKDYKCEKCGAELDFDEVGYLGARDPKDTACSPFTDLLCLCRPCVQADPRHQSQES